MPDEKSTAPITDRNGRCRIQVSTNNMEATLLIDPPMGAGNWPTIEEAMEAIRAEGITFGINTSAVEHAVNQHSTGGAIIARGKAPVVGKDAEINYFFETGVFRKACIEDDTGKVDFRQIQTVQNVTSGQVIAEKILATQGESGSDVRGHELAPVSGKDKVVKLGKNVNWIDKDTKIIATGGGEPTIVGGKVAVLPIYELKGDVNYDSGNVNFSGNLVIRGNVESGFKVEAEGDVTIYGNVDTADVKAGGNLLIQGGVSGMDKAEISCTGDFSAKYIEHVTVNSESSITIKESIMHCQVSADSKIIVEGGKGLIVGGLVRAGEEISAKTVGSRLGTVTELDVGVKPKTKQELQDLENQLKQNVDSLEKAEKAITILSKIPNISDDKKEMLQNLVKTSYALKAQIAEIETTHQDIMAEIQNPTRERGRIRVKETMYPGVRVTMGKTTIMIQDEIKYASLVYSEGEIQVQPYR
ncbi:MAG TPA: hypothetical protein DDW50_05015 [Firmicutes bacterium]|jgi:uncharacterized protein|nr:hypothetical protein [Bacillota bacterium]